MDTFYIKSLKPSFNESIIPNPAKDHPSVPKIRRHSRSGFTLIELIIVIAIIGILVTIAIPMMRSYIDRANVAKAHGQVDKIVKAIILLESDTGRWPGHQIPGVHAGGGNEIWNLNTCSSGLTCTDGGFPNWNGPYIDTIPLDPWNQNYFMDSDFYVSGVGEARAVVGSFGPVGKGQAAGSLQNAYDPENVIKLLR
jgi:general secretion pathway protein G